MDPGLLAGIVVLIGVIAALLVPIDRLAFVAMGAFCVVVTWNGFRLGNAPVGQGGGGALSNAFLILAVVSVAALIVAKRPAIRIPLWMLVATGGFVLAAMLTLIFPPDDHWINQTLHSYRRDFSPPFYGFLIPRSDLLTLATWQIAMVAFPLMITLAAPTISRIKRLVDLFVVSCVVNAGVGILGFLGLQLSPRGSGGGRETGLTLHANYLSLTCVIGIPLALYWVNRGGRWKWAGIAATFVLLGGAYVSGGRAGAITAPLALVATIAVLPNLRRSLAWVIPATGIVMVLLLAFTPAGDQLLQQLRFKDDTSAQGSEDARANLANLAVDQFMDNPVHGIGFGVIQDAHSIYLQLLAAGGVIALVCFFIYIWGVLGCAWRARAGPARDVATVLAVCVVTWLVNGVINAQLADKYLYMIPGFLVALYYATAAHERAAARQGPPARTELARPPAMPSPPPEARAPVLSGSASASSPATRP